MTQQIFEMLRLAFFSSALVIFGCFFLRDAWLILKRDRILLPPLITDIALFLLGKFKSEEVAQIRKAELSQRKFVRRYGYNALWGGAFMVFLGGFALFFLVVAILYH